MPGYDADSPWMTAMRRRQKLYYGMLAATLIMYIVLVGLVYFGFRLIGDAGSSLTGIRNASMGVILVLVLFSIIVGVYQLRRHRRLMVSVPEANGNCCPFCHRNMKSAGDDRLACGSCKKEEPTEVIHDYWTMYALDMIEAAHWMKESKSRDWKGMRGSLARFRKKITGSPFFGVLYFFSLLAVLSVGLSYFTSQSFLAVFIGYFPLMLIMAGILQTGIGRSRRKGATSHCSACEYQCPPSGPCPECCPECGADWQAAGAIIKGLRTRTPKKMLAGITMMLLGAVLMFSPLANMNWKYRLLPTNSLIAQTTGTGGFTYDEWNVLRLRTLSREQVLTLSQGLLDKRVRKGYASTDADNWLVAQIKLGSWPNDLVERYYLENIEFSLEGSIQARIGATVRVELNSVYRHTSSSGSDTPFVFIGDFRVNGVSVPDTRAKSVIAALSMNHYDVALELEIPPGEEVRVQLDIWLVFAPFNSLNGTIIWQEDGTPLIPPGVAWDRKITLEHVIEVTEE